MTPQAQITLETIAEALNKYSLADARMIPALGTAPALTVSGTLIKITKREGLKLVVKADNEKRSFEIYARFNEREAQEFLDAKIRKNSQITVMGHLQSFGTHAVALAGCRIRNTKNSE